MKDKCEMIFVFFLSFIKFYKIQDETSFKSKYYFARNNLHIENYIYSSI